MVKPCFLLNDFYQLKMVYSYWKNKTNNNEAVFAAYFRKNPFDGEFTIFAGLGRFLEFLQEFRVCDQDIVFMRSSLPSYVEEEFYDYMKSLTLEQIEVVAFTEGTVVFPVEPLIQITGPLARRSLVDICCSNPTRDSAPTVGNRSAKPDELCPQCTFSLVATNACRFRLAAGPNVMLAEFGCRRAQGPDGAVSSSLYSYIGGFDSTSNALAAKMYSIPTCGTIAHSYVCSFGGDWSSSHDQKAVESFSQEANFKSDLWTRSCRMLEELHQLGILDVEASSKSELEAFVSYAWSYPSSFVAVIDTYNVLKSGLPNFCAVALALRQLSYQAVGVRIDSGDLAYFSSCCREVFGVVAEKYECEWFRHLTITASNEISIPMLTSMASQGHDINVFGIGTNLVTCTMQPSLGMVYKLTELNGEPTMKMSEDIAKLSIPFKKKCFRLYNKDKVAVLDLLQMYDEPPPMPNQRVLCIHPYHFGVRAYVVPSAVESLHKIVFANNKITEPLPTAFELKQRVQTSLSSIRSDHVRLTNSTPYKVSLSERLSEAFLRFKGSLPVPVIR